MKNTAKFILLNLFWFVIIAVLSYRMPFYVDDYLHRTSFLTGEDITDAGMIIPSVREYYNIWGGRALSMFFIQLMLMLPRWIYAFVNGCVYVALVNVEFGYLNVADTEGRVSAHRYELTALLFFVIWFFMPDFAEVVTWTTGAVTYLWMHLVILGFGCLYFKDYFGRGSEDKTGLFESGIIKGVIQIILYITLGFCAGLSAEASACTLVLALVLYVFGKARDHRIISVDKWCGIIASFAGFGVLMLAPGNRVRNESIKDEAEAGVGILALYVHRIGRETFYMLLFLGIPVAICIALYVMSRKKEMNIKTLLSDISSGDVPFFILLSLVSVYVMTFSRGFANRIYQFPLLMLAIAIGEAVMAVRNSFAGSSGDRSERTDKAIRIIIVLLICVVLAQIVAGSLFATQSGSFFDRQMLFYHYDDISVEGLLPGNGAG